MSYNGYNDLLQNQNNNNNNNNNTESFCMR